MNRNEYNLLKKAILSDPYYEKRGKPKKETWSARYKDVVDGAITYRRFSGGFKTKKACKEAFDEFTQERLKSLEKIVISEEGEKQELTFVQLVETYYAYKKARLKESSFIDDKSKIESRILPFFEQYAVSEITPAMVIEWQNSLTEYSFQYRVKLNSLMKSIFAYGEKIYDQKNPARNVDPLRNTERKKEMQFWTPEEFQKFIEYVDDPMYKLYFQTLYISGCRRGEGMALTWADVDFETNSISINASVTNKGKEAYNVTTPKTLASARKIVMPNAFMQILKQRKESENFNDTDYVFGTSRPVATSSVNYKFDNAIKASGVKKIRIHDLRHSCASYLISKGFTIVAISKRLGHASTKETLDTYAHLFPSEADLLAKAFDDIL